MQKKVVVHGQSAGSINLFIIATLSQAPDLMSSAIMQSGGGRNIIYNGTVQALSRTFANSLNCSIDDVGGRSVNPLSILLVRLQPLAYLQGKSTAELNSTSRGMQSLTLPGVFLGNVTTPAFSPYVDGHIISLQPSQQYVRVPSIFGSSKTSHVAPWIL